MPAFGGKYTKNIWMHKVFMLFLWGFLYLWKIPVYSWAFLTIEQWSKMFFMKLGTIDKACGERHPGFGSDPNKRPDCSFKWEQSIKLECYAECSRTRRNERAYHPVWECNGEIRKSHWVSSTLQTSRLNIPNESAQHSVWVGSMPLVSRLKRSVELGAQIGSVWT